MLPFIWKQIKQTFLSEKDILLPFNNKNNNNIDTTFIEADTSQNNHQDYVAVDEGSTMESQFDNESRSKRGKSHNCNDNNNNKKQQKGTQFMAKNILDSTKEHSFTTEKEEKQEPPAKRRKYIAKRLGSAMTVPFMPLKSKTADTEDVPDVATSQQMIQDQQQSTYGDDDGNNVTMLKRDIIAEKVVYTTRSGRQVRPMTQEIMEYNSLDDDDGDDYYGDSSDDDINNDRKIKRDQYINYERKEVIFYCPYKGCNASNKSKRSNLVAHIRRSHDSSIKTSMQKSGYVYICRHSGQEILFDEVSRGTLNRGDSLRLIKRNGSGSQRQAVIRTKKTGLSSVAATKMTIDSVRDHDDNDFASQSKTKDTLAEDCKQVKIRYYCPYKNCRVISKQDSLMYNHVREYHYKNFPILEQGKPYSFITADAEMLNFRNVYIRGLLSDGEPIIPKKCFK